MRTLGFLGLCVAAIFNIVNAVSAETTHELLGWVSATAWSAIVLLMLAALIRGEHGDGD